MRYFKRIEIGDRVWDFRYGWGIVKAINTEEYPIVVYFPAIGYHKAYNFEGKTNKYLSQTLFWDEIKFKIPEKPKISLKEEGFSINLITNKSDNCNNPFYIQAGLCRNDRKTAEKVLKTIKRFTRLLALRDQECPNSRGYEFQPEKENYYIFKNERTNKYDYDIGFYWNCLGVYFSTPEDAQKICDILNSCRFDLEGE